VGKASEGVEKLGKCTVIAVTKWTGGCVTLAFLHLSNSLRTILSTLRPLPFFQKLTAVLALLVLSPGCTTAAAPESVLTVPAQPQKYAAIVVDASDRQDVVRGEFDVAALSGVADQDD